MSTLAGEGWRRCDDEEEEIGRGGLFGACFDHRGPRGVQRSSDIRNDRPMTAAVPQGRKKTKQKGKNKDKQEDLVSGIRIRSWEWRVPRGNPSTPFPEGPAWMFEFFFVCFSC